MSERTKLYVDMLKGLSLGFLGAVLFREFTLLTELAFSISSLICFLIARRLTPPSKGPR